MFFTSGKYMIFLAIVFFAYWLLATPRRRVPVLFLLAASYYFYALWNPKFLALVFLISTVDFLAARFIGASESMRRRRIFLAGSILVDIGALFVFKYFNFFSASLAELLNRFGWQASPLLLQVIWPLGLSFFTFRSLSYVIDVYRKTMKPTESYIDYLAFVSFFPTIVAGPVVRAKELLPQFRERPQLTSDEAGHAIFLIMLGLVKKIAIANYLDANLVGRVFDQPQLYSSVETLFGIYGYALQIYCDFSGYSDIAIGSALLLGFRLPLNFNSPYRAQNLPDFWKRWHITLSTWLTDYVYFSIGGLRKRPFNLYRNVVLTMLIGGLWHGAAWTFVLWGGMHGLGLAVNRWWENRRRAQKRRPRQEWWIKAVCVLATFHFICLAWVFFRAASLQQAWEVLSRLGALKFETANLAWPVVAVLALGYLSHWFPKDALDRVRTGFMWLPAPVQAALILTVGFGLYYLSSVEVQFIYGNF
ncbi:MAG TPA: MBOAT family protein [Pyrinomonadaceae bacterium]|jgi:D-alanyl-lipoteichoic acid acyltransferase DltB (MBOAT superfamily)|nr:MBOAT family protein [Pyrinomonadaceae bacterium]